MVCPQCTLLHADAVVVCHQCGYRFTSALQHYGGLVVQDARLKIGAATGGLLFACLLTAVLVPSASATALSIGTYLGILSIANSWMAIYTAAESESGAGMRGAIFSLALLYSLAAELARANGAGQIVIPGLNDAQLTLPVPGAAITELVAAVLIVMDPLLVQPFIRWVGEGVQHTAE